MKKIITFIACLLFSVAIVNAETVKYELGLATNTTQTDSPLYPGGKVVTLVRVDRLAQITEPITELQLQLVYEKSIFEIQSTPQPTVYQNWNLNVFNANPDYAQELGINQTLTGTHYKLQGGQLTSTDYQTIQTSGPINLVSGITFKVKDNAPAGTYIIGINPSLVNGNVAYESTITVNVAERPTETTTTDATLHRCIIYAYNSANNASKADTDTLTDSEYQTILELACPTEEGNIDGDINDISELYKLTNLKNLYLNDSNKLKFNNIDFSRLTKLEKLVLSANFSSLDLSSNTLLRELLFVGSNVETIDLSKNTNLTVISIQSDKLKSLDVSKNTELMKLGVSSKVPMNKIDLSKNTNLDYIEQNSSLISDMIVSVNGKKALNSVLKLPTSLKVKKVAYTINSGDSVVKVDNGNIIGLKEGTAKVTAVYTLENAVGQNVSLTGGENSYKVEYNITVAKAANNIDNNPKTGIMDVTTIVIGIAIVAAIGYVVFAKQTKRL